MKSSQPLDLSSGFIDIETEQSQIVITQATEARCLKMLKTCQCQRTHSKCLARTGRLLLSTIKHVINIGGLGESL